MKNRLFRYCSSLLISLSLFSPLSLSRADDGESHAATHQRVVLKFSWLDDHGQMMSKGFSLSDMELMPQASITLQLPESFGIAGEHVWQGVPLRSLISVMGRNTNSLKVSTLNEYSVSVPVEDIERFNPTLVYRRDGMPISVREKGPFMLIYPFNRFPELNQQIYLNRLVWQVNEITLQ